MHKTCSPFSWINRKKGFCYALEFHLSRLDGLKFILLYRFGILDFQVTFAFNLPYWKDELQKVPSLFQQFHVKLIFFLLHLLTLKQGLNCSFLVSCTCRSWITLFIKLTYFFNYSLGYNTLYKGETFQYPERSSSHPYVVFKRRDCSSPRSETKRKLVLIVMDTNTDSYCHRRS